ncbi:MAG: GNAT family N-acetyltransferase [Pseudomonadota bacterium]
MENIRPIEAADQPEWKVLWSQYLAFYGAKVSEAVYTTTFARLLSTDPTEFKGMAAVEDGQLVGLAHYLFHRHGWRIENVVYLQDLYVLPAHRGSGLGRKLIEAVYAEADLARCPSVYWLTQDFNTEARQLYDRLASVTPFIKYQR